MGSTFGSMDNNMDIASEKDKITMQVQVRSEGDGMETIAVPETAIKKTSKSPKGYSPSYKNNFVPITTKRKEPKFVPYEPYKAAVSPIIPIGREARACSEKVLVDPSLITPLASQVIRKSSGNISPLKCSIETALPKSDVPSSIKSEPLNSPSEQSTWLQEKIMMTNRIERLEKEKKELEAQFNVQTQVNSDLKKLLVASLGEDMQTKVQYMSEDKANLGQHVLLYSQKLSENSEELEKVSVQSDLWKSKFEASSMLVEELAYWKSVLSEKLNEGTDVIEGLLKEHFESHQELLQIFSTLHHIQEAFDPCAGGNAPCKESPWNLSQLMCAVRTLSDEIRKRLLGSGPSTDACNRFEQNQSFSQTELRAHSLLSSIESLPSLTKLEVSERCALLPGAQACSLLPHTCSKEPNFNCCKQCSGKVRLV